MASQRRQQYDDGWVAPQVFEPEDPSVLTWASRIVPDTASPRPHHPSLSVREHEREEVITLQERLNRDS